MRPLLSLSLVYTYVARARVSTVREYPSFCSTGGLFDSNFRRNSCKLGKQYNEGRFERSSIEGNRPVEIFPALPGLMTSSSFRYFSKNNVRSSTFESNGEISRNGGGVTGIGRARLWPIGEFMVWPYRFWRENGTNFRRRVSRSTTFRGKTIFHASFIDFQASRV